MKCHLNEWCVSSSLGEVNCTDLFWILRRASHSSCFLTGWPSTYGSVWFDPSLKTPTHSPPTLLSFLMQVDLNCRINQAFWSVVLSASVKCFTSCIPKMQIYNCDIRTAQWTHGAGRMHGGQFGWAVEMNMSRNWKNTGSYCLTNLSWVGGTVSGWGSDGTTKNKNVKYSEFFRRHWINPYVTMTGFCI